MLKINKVLLTTMAAACVTFAGSGMAYAAPSETDSFEIVKGSDMVVEVNGLNFREGGSLEDNIQDVLYRGEEVTILSEVNDNGFVLVELWDGTEGYVFGEYLTEELTDESYDAEEDEEEEASYSSSEEEEEEETDSSESMTYLGNYKVTGYDLYNAAENGGISSGLTASGVYGTVWHTVAMRGLDFGTKIYIDGLGYFVVEDRCASNGIVDIAVNNNAEAYALTGRYDVYIVE